MKLFYTASHPDIIDVCKDADYRFVDTSKLSEDPVLVYSIDETEENAVLMNDILDVRFQVNVAGQKKYYVIDGKLNSRDGWVAKDW